MLGWWGLKDGLIAMPAVLLKEVAGPDTVYRLYTLLIVFVTISLFLTSSFSFISPTFAALAVSWCRFTSACGGISAGDRERDLWGHSQMDFSL